jgi:PAS domain S-box-containing protein
MSDNESEQLRSWYLARLRKLAHDAETARSLTPASLVAADRAVVERLIAQKASEMEEVRAAGKKDARESAIVLFARIAGDPIIRQVYLLMVIPSIVLFICSLLCVRIVVTENPDPCLRVLWSVGLACALSSGAAALVLHFRVIAPIAACLSRANERLSSPASEKVKSRTIVSGLTTAIDDSHLAALKSQEREKAIADYALNVTMAADACGVMLVVSPSCLREWGYLPEELVGKSVSTFIMPEECEKFEKALQLAKSTKNETKIETSFIAKNGLQLDMLWSMEWSDTRQAAYCIIENITAQKTLERVKQEFVSMISHDLKTPLNSLGILLEMLLKGVYGPVSEEAARLLEVANRSVWRLLNLIGQLLDLDKLDAGKFDLSIRRASITEIYDQAVVELEGIVKQKSLKISFAGEDRWVEVDAERLTQVVSNLLSNAAKYSPQGGEISVKFETGPDWFSVSVSDQGPGIPETKRAAIFDRFSQLSRQDAIERKGTGLGLAICKALVEAHGGYIGVKSSATGGSTFWFRMPLYSSGTP